MQGKPTAGKTKTFTRKDSSRGTYERTSTRCIRGLHVVFDAKQRAHHHPPSNTDDGEKQEETAAGSGRGGGDGGGSSAAKGTCSVIHE